MIKDQVVLVDINDKKISLEEKLLAHKKSKLHRAFSVYIFNKKGDLLLQKRDINKYHAGGLWTNTVCSHPRNEETVLQAVHRRLKEEMGFDCDVSKFTEMIYKVPLNNGLTEYEYLHIYLGIYEGNIIPNPKEVMDYKYVNMKEILKDMHIHENKYTGWFWIVFNAHFFGLNQEFNNIVKNLNLS